MNLGKVALRGTVGPLMVGHGTQKLFGWFGGPGPDATGGFFENLGLRPGKRHAVAAGVSETIGGVLLTLGALTPVAVGDHLRDDDHGHPQGPRREGPVGDRRRLRVPARADRGVADPRRDRPGAAVGRLPLLPRFKGSGYALLALAAAAAGSYLVTEKFNQAAQEEPASERRRRGRARAPGSRAKRPRRPPDGRRARRTARRTPGVEVIRLPPRGGRRILAPDEPPRLRPPPSPPRSGPPAAPSGARTPRASRRASCAGATSSSRSRGRPRGRSRWWIRVRCAECGTSRELTVTDAEAERYDEELAAGDPDAHARAAQARAGAHGRGGGRVSWPPCSATSSSPPTSAAEPRAPRGRRRRPPAALEIADRVTSGR